MAPDLMKRLELFCASPETCEATIHRTRSNYVDQNYLNGVRTVLTVHTLGGLAPIAL